MAKCPHCGGTLETKRKPRKRTGSRSIALRGRTFKEQRAWYDEAMRVKRGEMVWDQLVNPERFGARGGYVDTSAWLARRLGAAELRAALESGGLECPHGFNILGELENAERAERSREKVAA